MVFNKDDDIMSRSTLFLGTSVKDARETKPFSSLARLSQRSGATTCSIALNVRRIRSFPINWHCIVSAPFEMSPCDSFAYSAPLLHYEF